MKITNNFTRYNQNTRPNFGMPVWFMDGNLCCPEHQEEIEKVKPKLEKIAEKMDVTVIPSFTMEKGREGDDVLIVMAEPVGMKFSEMPKYAFRSIVNKVREWFNIETPNDDFEEYVYPDDGHVAEDLVKAVEKLKERLY